MEETRKQDTPDEPSGRKVLERVPTLSWGCNGDCTFLGALEAALAVTPYRYDYRTLMGVTGLAFRIRWFTSADLIGCPSSAVGEFPDETEAAVQATGWRMRYEGEWDGRPMARLAPDMKASIDRGLPILAYGEKLNVAVVFGYEDEGRTLLLRDYFHGDNVLKMPTADLKMFALFLEEHGEPLAPFEAAKQGIRLGVRNWKRRHEPEDNEERGYWHGPLAFQAWRDVLARHDSLNDEERSTAFFLDWWTFEALADARRNAGPFLRQVMPLFPLDAQVHLERAAELYEEEIRVLGGRFLQKDAFLGPWTGATRDAWTAAIRHRELETLSCAESLEAEAITELEKAV